MNNIKDFLRTIEEYATIILSFFVSQIRYRNKNISYSDVKKIAIIKLDHLGDVILSTPAIANVRKYFSNAHITLVVNPSSKAIAEMIPYVDEIILYNAKFFDRSGKTKAFDILKGIKFAVSMRRRQFDLIFDLRGSIATNLYAMISNSRYRLDRGSYLVKRKLAKRNFLQKRKSVYKGNEWSEAHEANVCLNILAEAGIPLKIKETFIDPKYSSKELDFYRNGDNTMFIVIHAGSPALLKRWSYENFVELIRMLLQVYPSKIFLVGGKDEYELSNQISNIVSSDRVINLAGKLSLAGLAYLLKQSHLFIGNDSGPMHIASACGVKVIGLYGPTDPERFGPYGRNCIALRMEHKCFPCAKDKCKFKNYRCIDQISADDVMNSAKELLANDIW